MGKIDGKQIEEDYLSGMSSVEISIKYGVSKEAILYHLRKRNVAMRQVAPLEDEEKVVSLYLNGKSTIEIGTMFGTSHTRIRAVLKLHGVKMRTKVEALEKYSRKNVCVICGTVFRPKERYDGPGRNDKKTCSDECHRKLLHNIQIEGLFTIKHGGSQVRYQRIRRESKPDVCEDCGAVPPVRIDTHHIDRNKSNNSLENVKVLCVVCHAKRHYLEDTRGLRGELPREKKDILLKENLE